MADGLFNLCGRRAVELKKNGKTYTMLIRRLADYALKEEAMVSLIGNPWEGIEAIKDQRSKELAMKIAADVAARPKIATLQDENRFDNSLRGIAWGVWRALCEKHPDEFPPNASAEQGIQLGIDFIAWYNNTAEILDALYKVEEQDILGNSETPKPAAV